MSKQLYDIYIVGLGGQGILTIGELLAHAALQKGWPVNFYPTKGMSQRGGFTQGQLRIGREQVGAALPPQGADLIISMERSEAFFRELADTIPLFSRTGGEPGSLEYMHERAIPEMVFRQIRLMGSIPGMSIEEISKWLDERLN